MQKLCKSRDRSGFIALAISHYLSQFLRCLFNLKIDESLLFYFGNLDAPRVRLPQGLDERLQRTEQIMPPS